MQFKFLKNKNNDLDLTPLTDMVFLVLLFFMVGATFDLNRSLKLELPKSFVGESDISKTKIVIEIDEEGNTFLNGSKIFLTNLSEEIKRIENYKSIIGVIDVLKILDITSISLVTEPKEEL